MTKTKIKIGRCNYCNSTIYINQEFADDETAFICNRWACLVISEGVNLKNCYTILNPEDIPIHEKCK